MAGFLWALYPPVHSTSGKDSQEQCFFFLLKLIKFVPNLCIIADIFSQKLTQKMIFVLPNPNGFFGWLEKSSSPSAALEREILFPTNPAQLG